MDIQSDSPWPVSLIETLEVNDTVDISRSPSDRSVDIVLGNLIVLRLLDGRHQRRIRRKVRAAVASCRFDRLDQLGKQLPAFGVLTPFAVFDVRPFGMSGHFGSGPFHEIDEHSVQSNIVGEFRME